MRKYQFFSTAGALLVIAGLLLLLQSPVFAQDSAPEALEEPPYLAEYYFAWVESAHADAEAEAFVHWNDEGEIPVECAKCHSTTGYLDFLGADGSEMGVVDAPSPLGTVVTCDACHASAASNLTSVEFPSGVVVENVGSSARCMECHQGRASTDAVNAAIEENGLTEDPNTVNAELGFINIHYYAAAASLYGGEVRGGYQYDGMVYQARNQHVPGADTCASCHSPHTLEVQVETCAECHEDVEAVEDLRDIRMAGSGVDYDGDGDDFEGIADEIATLQEIAYEAIQVYAREVAGTPIVYDNAAYPYFFIDTNDNGEVDEDEAVFGNKYNAFTGNLLKATYNYQVTQKDPGGYAHNPKYHINLLFDSIEMLNAEISEPVDMAEAHRNDPGHFDFTAEAFRHWDEDGEVPGSCARCHSSGGLPFYLENGVNINTEPSQSLACSTCHDDLSEFTLYTTNEVTFPSGAKVSFGEEDDNNLCLTCHQGRESTVSVNNAINRAGVGADEVSPDLAFRNIHYFAAGASMFGTEVKGAYEFEGMKYNGRFMHDEDFQTCTDCHRPHEAQIRVNQCGDCHEDVEELEDVRLIRADAEGVDPVDYDGDGDAAEPIADEVAAIQETLLATIQTYAADVAGAAIVYESHNHPYWFNDLNGNGAADEDEVNGDNRYASWTPNLLRAAYNYQFASKDPGAFVHNADYILQVMFDSIEAVGGAEAVASFTRPPVVVAAAE